MKRLPCAVVTLALPGLLVLAAGTRCSAQQSSMPNMPNMPGMSMPSAPTPQKKAPGASQTTGNVKPGTGENPRARAAENSVQNSEAQQRAIAGDKAGATSDAQSVQHATYTQQEFESPEMHVGDDLPAPELLGEAAAREPLTLQTLEGWADANSPTLAEARALAKRSEGQARQAGLPPNPSVGYSGEHLRGGSYGGGENGAFAEQTFVLGGKLGLRRGVYAQQAGAEKVEVEAQTFRVHNDVEQAFYDALTAQAQVDVRRKLLDTALDAVRTAHELANLGQQDAPEVLDAEVEAEQAKVEYEHAQRMYIDRFAMLVSASGKPGEPIRRLEGELEQPPQLNVAAVAGDIVGLSPVVRESQQEVGVAEVKLRDAKRESVPNLRVQAGAWWSGEQVNGAQTNGTAKPAGWMGFAQAGVQLPLWNRNQGNVEAAKADVIRAQSEVTRTQMLLKQRTEPIAQRYLSARFQAERYRDQMLPRAERAHALYVLKYQQMAAAYPQVLMSARTVLRLRLSYLEALNEEWHAAIALRNYTLEGGLDAPVSHGSGDTMLNLPTGEQE